MSSLFEELPSSSAVISECGTYRYRLDRIWGKGDGVVWVMLNPSTADGTEDDPTIRRCVGFSRRWGYERMTVVNLFALRSSDPRALAKNTDPVGPENNWNIREAVLPCDQVICAWGCQQHMAAPRLRERPAQVMEIIENLNTGVRISCLGCRKDGAPRHPLMLSYEAQLEPWA